MNSNLEKAALEWSAAKAILENVSGGYSLAASHLLSSQAALNTHLGVAAPETPLVLSTEVEVKKLFADLGSILGRELSKARKQALVLSIKKTVTLTLMAIPVLVVVLAISYWVYDQRYPKVWRAEYFPLLDFRGEKVIKTERKIKHFWGIWDKLPETIPADNFSARFTTCFKAPKREMVEFILASDDGSRLFIDHKEVMNLWSTHGLLEQRSANLLEPGNHQIDILFFQGVGSSGLLLSAKIDGDDPDFFLGRSLSLPKDAKVEDNLCP